MRNVKVSTWSCTAKKSNKRDAGASCAPAPGPRLILKRAPLGARFFGCPVRYRSDSAGRSTGARAHRSPSRCRFAREIGGTAPHGRESGAALRCEKGFDQESDAFGHVFPEAELGAQGAVFLRPRISAQLLTMNCRIKDASCSRPIGCAPESRRVSHLAPICTEDRSTPAEGDSTPRSSPGVEPESA
jgi:hypothetical protein